MDEKGNDNHSNDENGDLESKLTQTVLKLEEIDIDLYRYERKPFICSKYRPRLYT